MSRILSSSLALSFALAASVAVAAPPAKGPAYETVAEGFCAWAGLTEANYVLGRYLCPSDLRHKLATVIFVDAENYEAQLKTIYKTVTLLNPTPLAHGTAAETLVISRDAICLVVLVGKPVDPEALKKTLAKNAEDFRGCTWHFYQNVTGSKVPEIGGKYPFYCVFGPESGEPLASGAYDAAAEKKIAQLKKDPKNVLNWKPYFGTVEEPTAVRGFAKTVASGKPLEGLMAACQKGLAGKDAEKAKECQILFDALAQTRSDYLYDVMVFARSCPTRAFYEAQILMKQWPRCKKALKTQIDQINAIPDVSTLCKMYATLKKLGAEDFQCKNAGEAKKYEAELLKMKATCDGLVQKSKNNVIQNAAAWIANEAETLAPQMASKVPAK